MVRGFTTIELVVIIMIIGVLAVFASGRLSQPDTFEARGYYDELVSATRYAQRYAVTSGCTVQIAINANNYALSTQDANCGFGTGVQRPDGGAFSAGVPAGVLVTSGIGNYLFDAHGNVNSGGNVTITGGGTSHSFTITPVSGFINTP